MFESINAVFVKFCDYCNLDCAYCFEAYNQKEKHGIFNKARELRKFISTCNLNSDLTFKFTGGEVSLCLPQLEECIKELRKVERDHDIKTHVAITTNGTNMDQIIDLIDRKVVDAYPSKVSWDGIYSASKSRKPKIRSDLYTDNFFNDNIKLLGKSKHGKNLLVRLAVSEDTVDHLAESFQYALDCGCTKLEYYYLFPDQYSTIYSKPEFISKVIVQLQKIAEIYKKTPFDYENWNNLIYTEYIAKDKYKLRNIYCQHVGRMLYIDMMGRLYTCGVFSSDGWYKDNPIDIGNIYTGFDLKKLEDFSNGFGKFKPCTKTCDNYHCVRCPTIMYYAKDKFGEKTMYELCKLITIEKQVFLDNINNSVIDLDKIKNKMSYANLPLMDYTTIPDICKIKGGRL